MKPLAILLALLATPVLAADGDDTTVPERFQGHWASTVELCAPDPLDDANVRVSATLFEDWQTRFDVTGVTAESADMLILSGRLTYASDTSYAYQSAMRLELYDDGASLAVGEGEDRSTYVKCPS
jgi:hypothetical protein